jgi:hypothetical protein
MHGNHVCKIKRAMSPMWLHVEREHVTYVGEERRTSTTFALTVLTTGGARHTRWGTGQVPTRSRALEHIRSHRRLSRPLSAERALGWHDTLHPLPHPPLGTTVDLRRCSPKRANAHVETAALELHLYRRGMRLVSSAVVICGSAR